MDLPGSYLVLIYQNEPEIDITGKSFKSETLKNKAFEAFLEIFSKNGIFFCNEFRISPSNR